MADEAKVIRGLEFCLKVACTASSGEKCPYIGSGGADGCIYEMQSDALKLLKEQEVVRPERQHSGGGTTWWNVCGNCRTAINPNDKFCHECGKAVKWE